MEAAASCRSRDGGRAPVRRLVLGYVFGTRHGPPLLVLLLDLLLGQDEPPGDHVPRKRMAARGRRRPKGDGNVRVALFVTCINDSAPSADGPGGGGAARAAGGRGRFPRRAELLRPAAVQHRLPPCDRAAGAPLRPRRSATTSTWSRRPVPARRWCVTTTPRIGAKAAAEGRGRGLSTRRPVRGAQDVRADRVSGRRAEGGRTSAPTSRTASPTTPPATDCGCWAWATGRGGCWSTSSGLELRELPGAEECCGFGGTFAVKNPAVSAAMGADKVRNVVGTGAEAVCAVDNSCLMHIGGTLSRQGSRGPSRSISPRSWPRRRTTPTRVRYPKP